MFQDVSPIWGKRELWPMASVTARGARDDDEARILEVRRTPALFTRRRFNLASALAVAALIPYIVQVFAAPAGFDQAKTNALAANTVAVLIAFWMRLSIEIYPGIRRSYVIVPTVLAGHGIVFATLVITRLPYGRLSLILGLLLHVGWLYLLYVAVERRMCRRIAVVPAGAVALLRGVPNVEWLWLKRPRLHDARRCDAIVADFSADLPDEWEAFLAEAAIAGWIVYQHKQLAESLTGKVQLDHLSENTFGSLLPSRGYFYIKSALDFLFAVLLLPLVLPFMAVISAVIRLDGDGPALFKQKRIGHGGHQFTVYKFRTMRPDKSEDARKSAKTLVGDTRITPTGRLLRKWRIDEVPQVINILKWEMSWIGPRPEAHALSSWYRSEIPFYVYRHVVKPGISGWAQVNQGHVAEIDDVREKLRFDFYYIKNFSPWLDLLIFFRTLKTMASGFGSR